MARPSSPDPRPSSISAPIPTCPSPAHFDASPAPSSALGSPIKTFTAIFRLDKSDPRLMPYFSAAVAVEPPASSRPPPPPKARAGVVSACAARRIRFWVTFLSSSSSERPPPASWPPPGAGQRDPPLGHGPPGRIPRHTVSVSPRASRSVVLILPQPRIAWMAADGAVSKQGDPIVKLDSSQSQQQLDQQQAALLSAPATLDQALAQEKIDTQQDTSRYRRRPVHRRKSPPGSLQTRDRQPHSG